MDLALAILHLLLNLGLLGAGAYAALRLLRSPEGGASLPAWWCAGFLLAAGQICFVATALGYLSLLSPWGLTLGQATLTGALLALMAKRGHPVAIQWTTAEPPWTRLESGAGLFLIAIATVLLLTGLALTPADFDSVGYRLSRIGLWLQDGAIYHTPTTDPRMNYLGFNGDLLMLWLTAPFPTDYPLTSLPQWAGGVMLGLATWALAEAAGFSRLTRLCLLTLYAAMPVVLGQMMTVQIDLLFAAFLVSGLLWLDLSLRRGASPWAAWVGIALAVGAKGTAFYMGPGLLALGVYWLWRSRATMAIIRGQAIAAVACLLLLAAPRYVENQFNYGNPFAPPKDIAYIHGEEEGGFAWEKLGLNAFSYGIEQLSPASNPPLFAEIGGALMAPLVENVLPPKDPYVFSTKRRPYYENLLQGESKVHEISLRGSWGWIAPALALVGCVVLLTPGGRRAVSTDGRALIIGLALAAVSLLILMSGFYNWSPFKFRYFLAAAPLVLLLGGVALNRLPARGQAWALGVCMLLATAGFAKYYTRGETTGLNGLLGTHPTISSLTLYHQAQMLEQEVPPNSRVAVSLPYYSPLSEFFRTGKKLKTTLLPQDDLKRYDSAEAFLRGRDFDFLIVHPDQFDGPIGNVYGRGSFHLGPEHQFNFTLFRLLEAEESSAGYLRQIQQASQLEKGTALIVADFTPTGLEPLKIVAHNQDSAPLKINLRSLPSRELASSVLAPGAEEILVAAEGSNQVALQAMRLKSDGQTVSTGAPKVEVRFENATPTLDMAEPWIRPEANGGG